MKFAHLADCHIGSWRDPKLRDVSTKAFITAIDRCVSLGVDFVLISGDLFNTSLPAIDKLKTAVAKLKELKDLNIPVYAIAGSHDFSPSGKTMLDVLETAGLLVNVVRGSVEDDKLKLNFTVDEKTGAKITGMLGKKGMLEKTYYENLHKDHLENEDGFKIFMFHTALSELKPKELEKMESAPISFLPKNFDYYAGGHVHIIENQDVNEYKNVVYPGPIFPNSFSELVKLGSGGFYVYDNGSVVYEEVKLHDVVNINLKCEHKTAEQVSAGLKKDMEGKDFGNAIVTIKLTGTLESGKISDIGFKDVFDKIYSKGAYFVMKNTSGLKTKDFQEIKVDQSSVEEIEDRLISEHIGQIKMDGVDADKEKELAKSLLMLMNDNKHEGEKVADFEVRLLEDLKKVLMLD